MADKKNAKSPQSRRKRSASESAPTAAAAQPQQVAQRQHEQQFTQREHEQQPAPRPLFSAPIAVRWRDLDAFNHVNNSNFLTYLEEARLQWLKDVPGPWFDAHSMPLLAAAELNYRAPIEWPASILVELSCERLGNSSITIAHRIVDAHNPQKLYCDGRTVLVWADPTTRKPVPLPEAIRNAVA